MSEYERDVFGRRLKLTMAGFVAWSFWGVTCHLGAQQVLAAQPVAKQNRPLAFDVVTIKPSKASAGGMGLGLSSPDSVSLMNVTPRSLIRAAYGIKEEYISGGPGWVGSDEYDVEGKVLVPDGSTMLPLSRAQISRMMQAMLTDRFKLVVHTEVKVLPVYELTVAKGGPKLKEAVPGNTYADGLKGPDGRSGAGMMMLMDGKFTGQAIALSGLVDTLSLELHRTVVDKTGLSGKYDITIELPREEGAAETDGSSPTLSTIVEDQLGLKLSSAKGPVKTLVIDHIERPTAN
jgi:uncharacterized protein (TIGR03435 family)